MHVGQHSCFVVAPRAGSFDVSDGGVELLFRFGLLQHVAEFRADPHRFEIPVSHLAEADDAADLAPLFDHVAELAKQKFHAVVEAAWRTPGAGLFPFGQLSEDPGIGEGSSTDRDGLAASFFDHPGRIGHRADVSVSDDGNLLDGLDDCPDAAAVNSPAESLSPRATVNRDRDDANLFELASELWSRELRAVPAEPHFHGDRNRDRFHDALHEIQRAAEVAHHAGSRSAAGDLLDGAAHVDVDRVDAPLLQKLSGLAHDLRLVSEDLYGKRLVLRMRLDHPQRFFVQMNQSVRAHQVRCSQADSADLPYDAAER